MSDDRLVLNKSVVRRIYEDGYDRGDPDVFETLYAFDFVHHSKVIFDVRPAGLGELDSMRRFRAAMPDVRFRVIDQVAEGDMVATRLHISGHPVTDYGTVQAADGAFDVHALALFRLVDGLVAEEWFYVDGGHGPNQ
jgi:predicted ester cyclase